MKILYGTGNKGKVENVKKIIKAHGFDAEIYTLKDINFTEEIIEDGETFEENSLIKAKAIKKFCIENGINDKIIITDDAGLCVDKLNGGPGVYTGRYAGEHATQEENLDKLLFNLKDYKTREERKSKFVCVLTAILPEGEIIVARGECNGSIAIKYEKLGGLTYSPVFIPDGFDKPMGDMDDNELASVHSHRDLALEELVLKFKQLGF